MKLHIEITVGVTDAAVYNTAQEEVVNLLQRKLGQLLQDFSVNDVQICKGSCQVYIAVLPSDVAN